MPAAPGDPATSRTAFYTSAAELILNNLGQVAEHDSDLLFEVLSKFCTFKIGCDRNVQKFRPCSSCDGQQLWSGRPERKEAVKDMFGVIYKNMLAEDDRECSKVKAKAKAVKVCTDFKDKAYHNALKTSLKVQPGETPGVILRDGLSPVGLSRFGELVLSRVGVVARCSPYLKGLMDRGLRYDVTGTLVISDPGADEDDQAALHALVLANHPFALIIMHPDGNPQSWEAFMNAQQYSTAQRQLITIIPAMHGDATPIPTGINLKPHDMLVIAGKSNNIVNQYEDLLESCTLVSYQGNLPYKREYKPAILVGLEDNSHAFNDTGSEALFTRLKAGPGPKIVVSCVTSKECLQPQNVFSTELMDRLQFRQEAKDIVMKGSFDMLVGRINPHVFFGQSLINATDGPKPSNYNAIRDAAIAQGKGKLFDEIKIGVKDKSIEADEPLKGAIEKYCDTLKKAIKKKRTEDERTAKKEGKALVEDITNTWYASTIEDLTICCLVVKELTGEDPVTRDGDLWQSARRGQPPTSWKNTRAYEKYLEADKFTPAYDYVAAKRHLELLQLLPKVSIPSPFDGTYDEFRTAAVKGPARKKARV